MVIHWECGVENVRALTDVSTPLATEGISAGVPIASVALKGSAFRHKDIGPFERCIARRFLKPMPLCRSTRNALGAAWLHGVAAHKWVVDIGACLDQ